MKLRIKDTKDSEGIALELKDGEATFDPRKGIISIDGRPWPEEWIEMEGHVFDTTDPSGLKDNMVPVYADDCANIYFDIGGKKQFEFHTGEDGALVHVYFHKAKDGKVDFLAIRKE